VIWTVSRWCKREVAVSRSIPVRVSRPETIQGFDQYEHDEYYEDELA
jgi:hypothetical protein